MVDVLLWLLIILLLGAVALYVINNFITDPALHQIALLVVGALILIVIIMAVLGYTPAVHGGRWPAPR